MFNLSMKLTIAATLFFSLQLSAQNFDIDLLKSINGNESSFKTNFFKADGKSVTVVNIAAPLGVLTAGLIKHDKKLQLNAVYMVGAYLSSSIVTHAMKNIIKRERPYVTYPFIEKRDAGGSYSFPSGHTSAAFCSATSLSLYYHKWYVIAPAYLWASSIAYARMYQGVHYPTDVLAGAVVGVGSAWLSYKIQKHAEKKQLAKKTSTANKPQL